MSNIVNESSSTEASSASTSFLDDSISNSNHLSNNVILDGTFFKIVSKRSTNNKVTAVCVKCQPNRVELRGQINSTSNFCSHLRRQHGDAVLNEYKEYLKSKKLERSRERSRSSMYGRTISRSHVISQDGFNSCITNYVLHSMVPLQTVDDPYFREIFDYLQIADYGLSVMGHRNLRCHIENLFVTNIFEIKNMLKDVQFVCTTVDVWSAMRRSFLGVTAHWIVPETYERKSVALACRKFRGTHSYDRIPQILQEIHMEYNLSYPKLTATVTDNTSNFTKAFRIFGIESSSDNDENAHDIDIDDAIVTIDNTILRILPRHIRCFAHTLSLCVTTDVIQTIKATANLNAIHFQTMQKCSELWNAASRPKSAEVVENVLGHTLSRPETTRWNSLYDALSQILKIKDKNYDLCNSLNIKNMLTDQNYLYIEEHLRTTAPVTQALDILQGECNIFYGMAIPCLYSLKQKLENLNEENWVFCKPVIGCLINSIQTRFSSYLDFDSQEAKNAIIATFSHPFFKNRWLSCVPSKYHDTLISIFKAAIYKNIVEQSRVVPIQDIQFLQLNTFFQFDAPCTSVEQQLQQNKNIDLLTLQYFTNHNNGYSCFSTYPEIKTLFLKYNTPLPSSRPVERLFSFATMINTPNCNRLSDEMFEQRVVLRANLLNTKK